MARRMRDKTSLSEDFSSEMTSDLLPGPPIHMAAIHSNDEDVHVHNSDSLSGDRLNIAVLTFLYVLQGIPLGLSGSIPMILSSRKVSYKEQAVFSFAFWPFSVKLLWAPLVDSIYWLRLGRRKSWMIPTQYLIGLFMILLSREIPWLIGDEGTVNVTTLTMVFFAMNFLAATQDIAVDGWALTMLKRENVGWASTCNTVGQTAGYFLGNVVFLALESPNFCNTYLRSAPHDVGLVTLSGFTYFWGIVFFVTTTLVLIFKREKNEDIRQDSSESGVIATYKQLYGIIRLPTIVKYVVVLLTCKVGFAAADAITGLKLIEAGMAKEKLALMAIPMVPIDIILPLIISKYTAGPRPMDIFLKAMPYRLVIGLWYAVLVFMAAKLKSNEGDFPYYFYALILGSFALHQVAVYSMFVATMAFHAKVSDPAIGGTYMTLLNTLSNLGGNWPSTAMLWCVDGLTYTSCDGGTSGSCIGVKGIKDCEMTGGHCRTYLDGYYLESVLCFFLGVAWYMWQKNKLTALQREDLSKWSVRNNDC